MSPRGLFLRLPIVIRLQAEVEHPFRLALLLRNQAHHVLVKARVYYVGMHVGGEAELVFLLRHLLYKLVIVIVCCLHFRLNIVRRASLRAHFCKFAKLANYGTASKKLVIKIIKSLGMAAFLHATAA